MQDPKMMAKNRHTNLVRIQQKVTVKDIKVFNHFLAIKNHKKGVDLEQAQIVVHKQSNLSGEKIAQK